MSSTLTWTPEATKSNVLDDGLKIVLRKRYGDPVSAVLRAADVLFLEGVASAGNARVAEAAQALIDAIEKHGGVIVREVF